MDSKDRALGYAAYYLAWASFGVLLGLFLDGRSTLALLPAVATAVGLSLHVLVRKEMSYPGAAALLSAILGALIIPLGIAVWFSPFAFFTGPPGLVLGSYLLVAGLERPLPSISSKSLEIVFLISSLVLLPLALLAAGLKGFQSDYLQYALFMLLAAVLTTWGTKYWIYRRSQGTAL